MNMNAMNGNAYKMIEIKKVERPIPPQITAPERYEPLPNPQATLNKPARVYQDSPPSLANTLQRPVPPPPPSRDGTLNRMEVNGINLPQDQTNGVAIVTPELPPKEEEKWWWVCCLEFCFCLL